MRFALQWGGSMSRKSEITDVGDQTMIDGVRLFDRQSIHWIDCVPVSPMRDRLAVVASQPMTPKRNLNAPQKQCDLFCALLSEVQQEAACLMVRRIAFAPVERMPAERRAQIDLCDLIAQSTKET